MKNFYIIANRSKEKTLQCASSIQSYLQLHGACCKIHEQTRILPPEYRYTDASLLPEETDCVLILGGDGTFIQAAHDIRKRNLPVIGVNLGTLGYLAEIDEESLYLTLDRLLANEFMIENRMLLDAEILREDQVMFQDTAVNDAVLTRSGFLQAISFSLLVNGQLLSEYRADGMIVATPTGSTAYSYSAGGPIVMPTSSLFVVTPVSPHTTMNARSIILPSDVQIELQIDGVCSEHAGQVIYMDGMMPVMLQTGDRIRIRSSEERIRLVRLSNVSFLDLLRRKLN